MKDGVFGFYYAGDLERFEQVGVELVPFNTLIDKTLPDIDGLFIGGGFPETQMAALEGNQSLRQSIYDFIERGGPAYAECGGLMYLTRSLSWNGKQYDMVGTIPADCIMCERPQGRGYVKLCQTPDAPWGQMPVTPTSLRPVDFRSRRLLPEPRSGGFFGRVLAFPVRGYDAANASDGR